MGQVLAQTHLHLILRTCASFLPLQSCNPPTKHMDPQVLCFPSISSCRIRRELIWATRHPPNVELKPVHVNDMAPHSRAGKNRITLEKASMGRLNAGKVAL